MDLQPHPEHFFPFDFGQEKRFFAYCKPAPAKFFAYCKPAPAKIYLEIWLRNVPEITSTTLG